jgi:hypothetical protein
LISGQILVNAGRAFAFSFAVYELGIEAVAVIAGFEDMTAVCQTIEERGCNLGVSEDRRLFS